MSSLDIIATKIIKEQELVIGPLAWSEARKVNGLSVIDDKTGTVSISGDSRTIVDLLVGRYERLFGRAAQEVCRDAVRSLIVNMPPTEIPTSLR